MELRMKYRIMGALVGTANSKGWSSSEAGRNSNLVIEIHSYDIYNISALPLELTKCETQLLIDEGLAILVSKTASLTKSPSLDILQNNQQELTSRLEAQADVLKAEKIRETERHVDKILSGKRNKLVKQGKADEG